CGGFGWDLDRPMMVLVAELGGRPRGAAPEAGGKGRGEAPDPDGKSRGAEERSAQERLAAAWTTAVRRHDKGAAVASFAHEVVAVVGADGADPAEWAAGPVQAMVKEASSIFAEHLPVRRTFSTG